MTIDVAVGQPDPLAGIELVDWTAAFYNNGDDMIAALRTAVSTPGSAGKRALAVVCNCLLHQGSVYPGSAAALPFLLAAVENENCCNRPELLSLAAFIANGVHDHLAEGGWASLPRSAVDDTELEDGYNDWWFTARDVVEQALPRVVALTRHADPAFRISAVHLLAAVIRRADEVQAALSDLVDQDDDPVVRLAAVCAAAMIAARRDGGPTQDDRRWFDGLARDAARPDEVRLGAALHALSLIPDSGDDYRAVVEQTASDQSPPLFEQVPWVAVELPWLQGFPGWASVTLDLRPQGRAAVLMALMTSAAPQVRSEALRAARFVACQSRGATPEIAAAVAQALTDDDPSVRLNAARELAFLDYFAAPHADALHQAASSDPDAGVAAWATMALAHSAEGRAVAPLADLLGAERYPWPQQDTTDAPHHFIAPLKPFAAALTPTLRRRLRTRDDGYEWSAVTRDVVTGLRSWGRRAGGLAEALLSHLLDGAPSTETMTALGEIGRESALAASVLARRAHTSTGDERVCAAWAHWRVTGIPDLFTSVVSEVRDTLSLRSMKLVADGGPVFQLLADFLRRQLSECDHEWKRIEIAHALWRVTGDVTASASVLLGPPCLNGRTGRMRNWSRCATSARCTSVRTPSCP